MSGNVRVSGACRRPLASIVLTVFNGEQYLRESIDSCLVQTYRHLELLIVDDGSTDASRTIAEEIARRDPRVRCVFRKENGGIARAFNTGFQLARGEFYTRMSHDDLFAPNAIEVMAGELEHHPHAGLVYCDMHQMDGAGAALPDWTTPDPKDVLVGGNRLGVCLMWRRIVWHTVGGFNPIYDMAEDYDYWLRVQRQYPLIRYSGPAPFYYRRHTSMATQQSRPRQIVAETRIEASQMPSRWQAGARLSDGYFDAAYEFRRRRQFALALQFVTASIGLRPWKLRGYRGMAGIVKEMLKGRQAVARPSAPMTASAAPAC